MSDLNEGMPQPVIVDGNGRVRTGDAIPNHLQRCGRKTWDEEQFGQECRMAQPDGFPCGGRFTDPRRPGAL